MEVRLRYLVKDRDERGNVRYYVKKRKCGKIRIRAEFGSPAFFDEYKTATASLGPKPKTEVRPLGPQKGTLGWLVNEFELSKQFAKLDERSRRVRHNIHEAILESPPNNEAGKDLKLRDCPLDKFTRKHVKWLRTLKEDTPGAANNWLSALRVLFAWGMEYREDDVLVNPTTGVKDLDYEEQGFHTWTIEEVEQFQARHPRGTRAHLALAILLFTGARRSDAVNLGPASVKGDSIRFQPKKTRKSSGVELVLPLLDPLKAVLDASDLGQTAFLETQRRKPFTSNGFGNWFRDRCDEAGLKQCTAHGLRKAGACIAAENGATVAQLNAIFGWTGARMAMRYIEEANRKKLAQTAMPLLIPKTS